MDGLQVPAGVTDIKPIRAIVYEHLREAILDGRLGPGARLVERDIAEKFAASRTPVREALRRLESEGLTTYVPRKGDIVRAVDAADVRETFAIRKALECLALESAMAADPGLAARLATVIGDTRRAEADDDTEAVLKGLRAFDEAILEAAGMPRLKAFLQTLQESLRRFRRINLASKTRRSGAIGEHERIVAAIGAGDLEKAKQAVGDHIDAAQGQLLKNWGMDKYGNGGPTCLKRSP